MWWLLVGCLHRGAPPAFAWADDGRLVVDPPVSGTSTGRPQAWIEGDMLRFTKAGGEAGQARFGRWIDGEDNTPPPALVGWIDDERIYVHQLDPALVYAAQVAPVRAEACRVYHVPSAAWSEPLACLEGDFLEINSVVFDAGRVIVASHGEGHPGLSAWRWTPEAGLGERLMPELDLYPFGPVIAVFRGEGLALLGPCHLGDPRPCQAPDGDAREDEAWRHYAVEGGTFVLVRAGLPAGAMPHPTAPIYAWAQRGRVCVGDPDGAARCKRPGRAGGVW